MKCENKECIAYSAMILVNICSQSCYAWKLKYSKLVLTLCFTLLVYSLKFCLFLYLLASRYFSLLMVFFFYYLEFPAETPNDSSNAIKTNGTIIQNDSHMVITEKTNKVNSGAVLIEPLPSFLPEMQNSQSNMASSSKSKGKFSLIEVLNTSAWVMSRYCHMVNFIID